MYRYQLILKSACYMDWPKVNFLQKNLSLTFYHRSTDDDRLRQEFCDDEVFEFRSAFTRVSDFYKKHGKGRLYIVYILSVHVHVKCFKHEGINI